jgi:hypothetical protein
MLSYESAFINNILGFNGLNFGECYCLIVICMGVILSFIPLSSKVLLSLSPF